MLRFFIAISLLLLSCGKSINVQSEKLPKYSSYKDVPGVTQEEIQAIETLKGKKGSFIYGMNESTEIFYGDNDEIRGYAALLCSYLSDLFGMSFKPAIYLWDDLVEGLENGSIDFTGEMTATEERKKKYYMTSPIAERSIKYFRVKNSDAFDEIAKLRPLRYAFLKEVTTVDDISPFLSKESEIFFVSNHQEAYDMLKSGKIDAFFEENTAEATFNVYGDIVNMDFLPLIYTGVSMSTQNSELAPVISVTQKMLQSGSIHYITELYSKGHREYMTHKLFRYNLDEVEREYIRDNPVVRYAVEYDNYPMSFYNKHEKRWQGIFLDVLAEMEALLGISFEPVNKPYTEWPDLLKMLENGEASIISELIYSKERQNDFLWPKNAILQDKYALLSKESLRDANINEILRMKVGLAEGTAHANLFKTWFRSHPDYVEYKSTQEQFEALERGEVDMVMASQYLLLYLTNYMELPDYKINILFSNSYESFLGLNKDEVVLRSIIDKALEQIDKGKISGKWMRKTFDYRAKIAQSRLPWLIGVSALLFLVIILMLILHRRILSEEKRLGLLVSERTAELDEQRKLLEHISLTDQLTNIPNRRNFDCHLNSEWRRAIRYKLPLSLLMMDVDRFKLYNDTYGHQQGDIILRSVAKCIEKMVKRPGDLVARWGGEEFTVLLPNTNSAGALEMAESAHAIIRKSTEVTVSIGVVTLIPGNFHSIDNFISAADDALYRAKEMGRNRIIVGTIF
ncbi:MAG: diguanylate cyclase [Fibromonadales bacterium]|nr:diguanylate cyclase [Fibromonadales bacterium]